MRVYLLIVVLVGAASLAALQWQRSASKEGCKCLVRLNQTGERLLFNMEGAPPDEVKWRETVWGEEFDTADSVSPSYHTLVAMNNGVNRDRRVWAEVARKWPWPPFMVQCPQHP
jgi:hypothetical protein